MSCAHDETTRKLDRRLLTGWPTADRCLACGHRARDYAGPGDAEGTTPRRTRVVVWRWPTEHLRRAAARKMGRRARAVRAQRAALAPAGACGYCGQPGHRTAQCPDK